MAFYVGLNKDASEPQHLFNQHMKLFMKSMRIPAFAMDQFIVGDPGELEDMIYNFATEMDKPSRPLKASDSESATSTKAADEHYALFRAKDSRYPPQVDDVIDGFQMSYIGLSEREIEIVLYCTKYFPNTKKATMSFIDVNCSLGVLVLPKSAKGGGKGLHSAILLQDLIEGEIVPHDPWQQNLGTLVGSAHLVVRIDWVYKSKDTTEEYRIVRPLHGIEYMSLIGWDTDMWNEDGCESFTRRLLANLAGNAFSGFASGPVTSAALASCGIVQGIVDELPETTPATLDSKDMDDGEEQDAFGQSDGDD